MDAKQAIELIRSREGRPHEDDWDLMEAAAVLAGAFERAEAACVEPDPAPLAVTSPKMAQMRNCKPGDVLVFRGEQTHRQQVTTIICNIGGRFTQEAAVLVDQGGRWCFPVTVVTCTESPRERKQGGRKPKADQCST